MWLHRTEFHQLLSRAKSCLLNVRCAMIEGSRVIGTLCPSVTDGQIGEKRRDMGQWSNPWSCSLSGSCKLTRPPLGRDGVKGRQPRHLLRFWKSPDAPSLLSPDKKRSNIAKKRRGSEEADTKRWSFVPMPFFDSVCSTVVSILLTWTFARLLPSPPDAMRKGWEYLPEASEMDR